MVNISLLETISLITTGKFSLIFFDFVYYYFLYDPKMFLYLDDPWVFFFLMIYKCLTF